MRIGSSTTRSYPISLWNALRVYKSLIYLPFFHFSTSLSNFFEGVKILALSLQIFTHIVWCENGFKHSDIFFIVSDITTSKHVSKYRNNQWLGYLIIAHHLAGWTVPGWRRPREQCVVCSVTEHLSNIHCDGFFSSNVSPIRVKIPKSFSSFRQVTKTSESSKTKGSLVEAVWMITDFQSFSFKNGLGTVDVNKEPNECVII